MKPIKTKEKLDKNTFCFDQSAGRGVEFLRWLHPPFKLSYDWVPFSSGSVVLNIRFKLSIIIISTKLVTQFL